MADVNTMNSQLQYWEKVKYNYTSPYFDSFNKELYMRYLTVHNIKESGYLDKFDHKLYLKYMERKSNSSRNMLKTLNSFLYEKFGVNLLHAT